MFQWRLIGILIKLLILIKTALMIKQLSFKIPAELLLYGTLTYKGDTYP